MNTRAERLLSAPIVPTLARLSAPGVLLVAFQSMVSVGDTYFVGRLGTAPLAGLALVFPLIMLLQMTSAGAMGGGVSSAIARALGAGDAAGARKLVRAPCHRRRHGGRLHRPGSPPWAILVSPAGRRRRNPRQRAAYSSIIFGGAITVWVANTLSSVLRGSGNMMVPALTLIGAACVHVPLSATLVPRIGIAGAGIAYVTTFGLAALAMALIVWRSSLRPQRADWQLEWRLFREILRVGAISSLNALQTVVTAVIITGFVGRYGAAAIAGYGVGLRLELQIPLVFAVGQALVVLVGVHIGAGRAARAKHIAWVGAGFAAAICLAIGADGGGVSRRLGRPVQQRSGGARRRRALPAPSRRSTRCSPPASRSISPRRVPDSVLPPMLAGTVRLALVIAGGLAAVSLQGLFPMIAAAMIVYGALTIWFVAAAKWKWLIVHFEKLADAIAHAPIRRARSWRKLLIDVAGLCVAARSTDYVRAALDGWEASGGCSAIGHERALDSGGAAFVNGTAAHGEDFDDTFEGGPIHAGAVIVPAVLAVASGRRFAGKDALRA